MPARRVRHTVDPVSTPSAPTPTPRPAINALPAYQAGKRPTPRPGVTTFKASSNENPYAPLPAIVEAVATTAGQMNRYPDPGATAMVAALAQRFGVTPGQIAVGTGSVGVLQQILQAMVDPGDEVIYAWRSFEAYPITVSIVGGVSVQIPLREERHDLDAMADAITTRTRVIIVCTPNNPTGTIVTTQEFHAFMTRVPSDVLVLVDEAYAEFVRDPQALDGLSALRRYPNVAVLRSFSKAYGLAGLRVGMAVAPESLAAAFRATAVPFGVSDLAQVAVTTALTHEAELLERVEQIVRQRDAIVRALQQAGVALADPQGNFLWLRLGERTADLVAACEEQGVVVRPFLVGDPQGAGVRITVGEPEADERLIRVISALAGAPDSPRR